MQAATRYMQNENFIEMYPFIMNSDVRYRASFR